MTRFAVIPAAAVADSRLSLRELSVLAALGIYTDRDGWCYPSSESLGAMLGVSGQMVRRSMAELERHGYLQTTPRYGDDGSRLSNRVRVLFDTHHPADALRVHQAIRATPPATPEVAAPATPAVTPPATSEVAAPATSEVAGKLPFKAPKSIKSKAPSVPVAFTPPDWVPRELWDGWLEVRRRKRAPNTELALKLAVDKLATFRTNGHDPATVLANSISNGWQGVFEPRTHGARTDDHANPLARRRGESLADHSQRVNAYHDARERGAH